MTKLIVAIAFLGLNLYTYHWMARDAVIPDREDFDSFPLTLGDWSCTHPESIDAKTLKNLGATDYLICTFTDPASRIPVSVYMGYHSTQVREEGGGAGENAIHPPAHCLPGSGWDIIESDTVPLDMPGFPTASPLVKRLIVAKNDHRQLVYYWYQSRGRVIAHDWQKILFVGWDRATRSRTDGALVRFMIPIFRGDQEISEQAFRDLAPLIVSELGAYLPI